MKSLVKITLRPTSLVIAASVILGLLLLPSLRANGDKFQTITNKQAMEMLDQSEADIRENYYDSQMHGLNLNQRFDQAREKIAKATSQDESLLYIAAAVAALEDSHTHFVPPVRPYGVDYGWFMEAVGDSKCYVMAVRPGSDAAGKGLKPGDQIVSMNGIRLVREDIANVEFSYYVFPQSGFHLVVQSPDGVERPITVLSRVMPGQRVVGRADVLAWLRSRPRDEFAARSRYYKPNKQTLFWKLPDFLVDPSDVNDLLSKVRGIQTLVLDLRGNPGGLEETGRRLVAGLVGQGIKIADRKGRKKAEAMVAPSHGDQFTGKLIVLVDSKSASAAEIFARVVQIEKRGVVLGDRSAGKVREAEEFVHAVRLNADYVFQYRTMVTVADLIMTDGKSLEGIGVAPDERILPSPADLAAGRDPVLARAAALAGIQMTAEEAGKIFPFEFPKAEMPMIGSSGEDQGKIFTKN